MRKVTVWLKEPGLDIKGVVIDKEKISDELNVYSPNGEYVYTVEGPLDEDVKAAIIEYDEWIGNNGFMRKWTNIFNKEINISTDTFVCENNIDLIINLINSRD